MRSRAFAPMVVAFLVVGVLLIPRVFRRAGNGLVATANWTSYRSAGTGTESTLASFRATIS